MVVDDETTQRACYWCNKEIDPEWLRNHTKKRIASYHRRVKRPRDYRLVGCPFCQRVLRVSRFPRHRCRPRDFVIQLQKHDPFHAQTMAKIRILVDRLETARGKAKSGTWPPTDPEIRQDLMHCLALPDILQYCGPWNFAKIQAAWAKFIHVTAPR